ncbi:MAG: ABC transporter permease [Egibacteraceae bacterium]
MRRPPVLHGALAMVARRLLVLPLVLLLVAAMTFGMVALSPFDWRDAYATGGQSLSAETAERIARVWDLDAPVHEQFGRWVGNVVRGDLGHSRLLGGQPVADQLRARVGKSALLVAAALALALAGGLVAGVLAAAFRDGPFDWLVRTFSFYSVASPSFWLALLAIWLFSIQLGWLPPGGTTDLRSAGAGGFSLRHLILPAVTLAIAQLAWFAMFVRNQLLEVLREDYVRFAEAQGLKRARVLFRHALPNALLPFLTGVGANLTELVGGSVLIETVFGWPGVGALAVQAAQVVDLPLLLGITLLGSVVIVLGNLISDLSYRFADPRVRQAAA